MKKILLLALVLVVAAIAFTIATWPEASTTAESPSTPTSPSSGSSATSPRPATPLAAIPEHLKDPDALLPAPLPLDFTSGPFERQKDGRILDTRIARTISDLNDNNRDPVEDLQVLHSLVGAYRKIFRENPIAGENREVIAALTGKNAYKLMFIRPNDPAIRNGELVDRWGSPFRFHPYSGQVMEVSSAGPDGQFGTGDDILIDEPRTIGPPEPEPES